MKTIRSGVAGIPADISRIVLFGIYGLGFRVLERLLEETENVRAVVTRPYDAANPQQIAAVARAAHIPVITPRDLHAPSLIRTLDAYSADVAIVAGYHARIPPHLLALARHGFLNIHGSLLPKYRGPVPHKWAIINGESTTGVTIHRMTATFDTGDVLVQRGIAIAPDDTADRLFEKISITGAQLVPVSLARLRSGDGQFTPQDENAATYQSYPTEEDARIDWRNDAAVTHDLIRGLYRRPLAWTEVFGTKIRILRADLTTEASVAPAGTVVSTTKNDLRVATSTFDLDIMEARAQPSGETVTDFATLCSVGTILS